MIKIGEYNTLKVARRVDFGVYLTDGDGNDVLLPQKYATGLTEGDDTTVFIYNDSEDRPIATTDRPVATVGTFALLKVKAVNAVGAFLEWGISGKDLLVPFREQKVKMQPGRSYVVYVYLDDNSGRIVASAKLDRFVNNTLPHYTHRQQVDLLVVQRTELGYKVIINGLHWGLVYQNRTYRELNVGDHCIGYIQLVRDDGKIDVTTEKVQRNRVHDIAEHIMSYLNEHDGEMELNDKSSPYDIMSAFSCSKKDFKKAIGKLYKERKIKIDEKISLP